MIVIFKYMCIIENVSSCHTKSTRWRTVWPYAFFSALDFSKSWAKNAHFTINLKSNKNISLTLTTHPFVKKLQKQAFRYMPTSIVLYLWCGFLFSTSMTHIFYNVFSPQRRCRLVIKFIDFQNKWEHQLPRRGRQTTCVDSQFYFTFFYFFEYWMEWLFACVLRNIWKMYIHHIQRQEVSLTSFKMESKRAKEICFGMTIRYLGGFWSEPCSVENARITSRSLLDRVIFINCGCK